MTAQQEKGRVLEGPPQGWSFENAYTGNFSGDLRINEGFLHELAGILEPKRSIKLLAGVQGIERVGVIVRSTSRAGEYTHDSNQVASYRVDPTNPDWYLIEINSQVIDGRLREHASGDKSYREAFQESIRNIILEGLDVWMHEEMMRHMIDMMPWTYIRLSQKVRNFWKGHKEKVVRFGPEVSQSPVQ